MWVKIETFAFSGDAYRLADVPFDWLKADALYRQPHFSTLI